MERGMAIVVMYGLLAITSCSYVQPLIVMFAIPFDSIHLAELRRLCPIALTTLTTFAGLSAIGSYTRDCF